MPKLNLFLMDSKKKIIFFFQREGIVTGGGKMDSYLSQLTRKYRYNQRSIYLDSLTKPISNLLVRLYNVSYLLGRTFKIVSYTILIPKEAESIIYLSSLLLKELYVYLLIARVIFGCKIIVYVHLVEEVINENISDNIVKRFLRDKLIHVANVILVNSDYTKNKMVSFGIYEGKIKIIYPLLLEWPDDHKTGSKNDNGRIRLLFMGTDFFRKGLNPLLEALEILDRGDIFLDIGGDVNKKSNVRFIEENRDLIRELENKKLITLLGEVSEEQRKKEFFTQADIFVMPSLSEGFGIVFAEAMAYSLPIIAANTTAVPELVRQGYNGILVPAKDSKELAKAIEALADNKEMRIKMGKNGYKMIKDLYTSYSIENEFLDVLKELSM